MIKSIYLQGLDQGRFLHLDVVQDLVLDHAHGQDQGQDPGQGQGQDRGLPLDLDPTQMNDVSSEGGC